MPCSVLDCGRVVVAKGYCDTHYRRIRRYGSAQAPPRPARGPCSVENCSNPNAAKGLCRRHYQGLRLHGDPLKVLSTIGGPRRRAKEGCDVADCPDPYRVRGYCDKHYRRWKLHGDPLIVIDPNAGVPWRTKGGYRILRSPGHPLARPSGHILEHRKVLFDAIGPGRHPCHWCGLSVSWDTSWPKSADALVVDHLDDDKANNRRENLVQSCQTCNGQRANSWRKLVATAPR